MARQATLRGESAHVHVGMTNVVIEANRRLTVTRILAASLAVAGILVSAPLAAHDREIVVERYRSLPPSPNNFSNKWWVDYQTDISEARRELRSDLRRATDAEDRFDARREYERELEDARYDYEKEMLERGYRVVSFRENRFRMARR
ncbi:hypothetical protein CD351_13705 [Erythrobacter sp. KY5]|nr:hypothetical protein CD351_13705 [Erythrobacter sp. KY5]